MSARRNRLNRGPDATHEQDRSKRQASVVLTFALIALLLTTTVIPAGTARALTHAGGSFGPEQKILDDYFRQYDRYPNMPYCARISVAAEPQELPQLPVNQVNGTNTLLDEHMAWHAKHARAIHNGDLRSDNNTYGDDFILMHRMDLIAYDAWRIQHAHNATRAWDPATPIPPDFAYDPPDACQPRNVNIPPIPLPTWLTIEGGQEKSPVFNYTHLCDFPTMNRLGKELDDGTEETPIDDGAAANPSNSKGYHSQVHNAVGGDMGPPETSMRDPIFWAWHKFLDSRARLWETDCAQRAPLIPTDYMDGMGATMNMHPATPTTPPSSVGKTVPDAPFSSILLACALVGIGLRKR